MSKRYSAAKAMNIAVVGSFNAPVNKKANILATDIHNAKQAYQNQEMEIPLDWIYQIPSSIKREWQKMSKAEKIVYGTIFASTVIGLGIAADYKYNEGKTVKNIGDYSKSAGKKIAGGAAGVFGGFEGLFKENQPPVADFEIKGNLIAGSPIDIIDKSYDPDGRIVKQELRVDGKITPTPTQTLSQGSHQISLTVYDDGGKSAIKNKMMEVKEKTKQPSDYDYYDKDFKIGIMIEGDQQFKQNVMNLIEAFKEVTPDDYIDLIKYAPKKIVKSRDRFNWYALGNEDEIGITETSVKRGGSDNPKVRLEGVVDIVPEFGNAKQIKTGVKFNNTYESEMDANIRKANYAVKVGAWEQEQAKRYIENISEQLKSGRYFDGDKLN